MTIGFKIGSTKDNDNRNNNSNYEKFSKYATKIGSWIDIITYDNLNYLGKLKYVSTEKLHINPSIGKKIGKDLIDKYGIHHNELEINISDVREIRKTSKNQLERLVERTNNEVIEDLDQEHEEE